MGRYFYNVIPGWVAFSDVWEGMSVTDFTTVGHTPTVPPRRLHGRSFDLGLRHLEGREGGKGREVSDHLALLKHAGTGRSKTKGTEKFGWDASLLFMLSLDT